MEHLHPGGRQRGRGRMAARRGIAWMMANSLVLYLSATLVQRAWWLLNTDIGQLIRRF